MAKAKTKKKPAKKKPAKKGKAKAKPKAKPKAKAKPKKAAKKKSSKAKGPSVEDIAAETATQVAKSHYGTTVLLAEARKAASELAKHVHGACVAREAAPVGIPPGHCAPMEPRSLFARRNEYIQRTLDALAIAQNSLVEAASLFAVPADPVPKH